MTSKHKRKTIIPAFALSALLLLGGCGSGEAASSAGGSAGSTSEIAEAVHYLTKEDIKISEEIVCEEDGAHAIEVSGEEKSYANVGVTKSGDASGDEADFYGENAAVFATEKATLSMSDSLIETDGTHANAVFSYGEGSTVNISDSVIETKGNCSGGLMTTGGGTMNATNLTIDTSGNSSAAIRSDRGGGTVTVSEGSYKTSGTGSPVIYSTADISVSDAYLESTASEGVVVEGKNSVALDEVTLVADNNTHNSDKSDVYNAVMIYQSMSGDADEGTSSFSASDSSITNKQGDIFFVNNTATKISLTNSTITNEDAEGVFLRAAAAGWGNEGSNGGKVELNASRQNITGDLLVDEISALNLYLKDGSSLEGAINPEGQSGDVYVEIEEGSSWTLTADSYVSGLTVGEGSAIDLNGHKLYVDGKEYKEGAASQGSAFEIKTEGGGMGGAPGDGQAPPDGGQAPPDGGQAPPDGGAGGEPPAKPEE